MDMVAPSNNGVVMVGNAEQAIDSFETFLHVFCKCGHLMQAGDSGLLYCNNKGCPLCGTVYQIQLHFVPVEPHTT